MAQQIKPQTKKIAYQANHVAWNLQVIVPVGTKMRVYNFLAAPGEILSDAAELHALYPRGKVFARSADVCWSWKP